MENKDYQQYNWLYEHYIIQKLSIIECSKASTHKISGATIQYFLRKYKIPTRAVGHHLQGKSNPMYGKHHSDESRKVIGIKNKGRICSESLKKKRSENMRGIKNHRFGKPRTHGRSIWIELKDGTILHMRSFYEISFASWLCEQGKQWVYEPQTFILNNGSAYTPDFLSDGIYYEVKGWYSRGDRDKVERFQNTYPDLTLEVVGRTQLKELGIPIDRNSEMPTQFAITQSVPRICPTCEKPFLPGRRNTKFCSYTCRKRPRTLFSILVCEVCGKEVEVYPCQLKRRTTCSAECGKIAGAHKRSGVNHWHNKKT
jgi:hypothetical protein